MQQETINRLSESEFASRSRCCYDEPAWGSQPFLSQRLCLVPGRHRTGHQKKHQAEHKGEAEFSETYKRPCPSCDETR